MAAFGIPEDAIASELAPVVAEDQCEIHPDNMLTAQVFFSLRTQWRAVAGGSGVIYLGLDYGAIPPLLELVGVPRAKRRQTFGELRVMEAAALSILNTRAADEPAA